MTPPADDTSKKLDGPSAVPSLGEQATGPDAGGSESSPVPSLGEQSTAGDQGSSIVDLGDLAGGIDDFGEIVELEVRYEIQDTLGSGGMGLVQRAIDRRLQRSVAIKRLKDELAKSRSAARRFLAEAQAVATLNHFNIVQVYDYGYATDGPFIVMELVEGQSLKERLAGGPLELETAVEIAGQLCDALAVAHGWGIVHRDIKPGNILLTPDGVPKLSDFGLARQAKIDEGQTRTGAVLGTLDFMSPEQKADATSVDARSDVWSLAATLYQMVTGELPRVIRGDRVDPVLAPVLAPVLLKALEEDPERRHESAEEFGEELRQVVIARAESMSASRYEIAEGTCAHCGAENELSRKFCRGCGKTLQDPCLNCRTPLAVWERFCGDCGTDALEALQQQLGTVETQRQEIASQRRSYRYQEAIEGLESLVSLDHSRLSEQSTWAGKALSVIREEYTEWGQRRESLVGAAEEQLAEGNDRAARGYLDEIPEPLHTEAVKALYERLTSRREEAKSLARSIRAAVADRDDTTTRPLLERFLKLRPGDKQAQSLYEQLQDRETETVFGSGEALQQNGPELVQVDSGSILDSRPFGRKLRRRQMRWADWTRNRRLTGMIGAGFLVVIGLLVFMWPETPDPAADRDVAGTTGQQDQSVAGNDNTQPQQVEKRLVDRPAASLPVRLRQGLVAYYPFNGNANDESGNGNDGEVTGATLSADRHRKDDRSYLFDGIDDRIVVTDHQLDIFGRAEASTISIWVNIDPQSGGTILTKGFVGPSNAGGNQYLHIGVGKYGVPWYALYKNDLKTGTWLYGVKESCVLGNWFHLVCVRDSESAIYVNGEDQTDHKHVRHHNQWMVDYDAAFGGTPLSFGAVPSVGRVRYRKLFDGHIDDIRIYNRALSAEEVNSLYEHERADPGQARTLRPSPAIAPFDAAQAKQHQQDWAVHLGTPVETTNSIGMKFAVIPPGEVLMGSPGTESDRRADETQHRVSITKPFCMGVTEVTQEQYQKVMGSNPSKFKGPQNPVEQVNWIDAVEFCGKLSAMPAEKTSGHVYRLPTEAEWEYACRSGTTTAYGFGDDASRLGDYGWFEGNSDSSTHPVGEKKPNAWGLYDMHGGVYEWCQDRYGDYPSGSATDPTGATSGSSRVYRGGCWLSIARFCRSAYRNRNTPVYRFSYLGFRVLRSSIGSAAGGGVKSGERSRSVGPPGASGAATRGAGVQAATNSIGMKLRLIPAGEFTMGSPRTESGRSNDETPHRVSITKPFYLGVTEVTQEQYQKVMGSNPSKFKGPQNPVEQVNWSEAVEFCRKLSAMPAEKTAGHVYRLPTEAEWEYACRSGTTTACSFGDDASRLGDYGWFDGNSGSKIHPVGEKKPNAWGLYDMHGNVWEWCQDRHGEYPGGSAMDPTGATSGSYRVFRGGGWYSLARHCRSAIRYRYSPEDRDSILGFRVLRSSIK